MRLSKKQVEMLEAFERDGEATDICDFEFANDRSGLAWRNREYIMHALRRKGLLDDNGVTDAGRAAIARERQARAA